MGKIVKGRKRKSDSYSHEENRHRICFFCLTKITSAFSEIKNVLKALIISHFSDFSSKFDVSDDRFPAVICPACHTKLYKVRAGAKIESLAIPDEYQNYPILQKVVTRARAVQQRCACNICDILINYGTVRKSSLKKPMKKILAKKMAIERRCAECGNIIGRGIRRKCNPKVRHNN